MKPKIGKPFLDASLGKIPPQAVDVEEVVLGAMLIDADAIVKSLGILKPSDFYKPAHEIMYQCMVDMFNNNIAVDILTTINYLKGINKLDEVGGGYYISQLTNRVVSGANAEHHAFIVKQKSMQRNLIKVCSEALTVAYDDSNDVFEMVDKVTSDIEGIVSLDISGNFIDAKSRMDKTVAKIKKGLNSNGVSGVPSGFTTIDRFTGGFQNGDLIFIGARPGNFKTGLVMAFAHKMSKLGFTPYISQQEMGEEQSGMRELAMHSGVDTQNLRRGVMQDGDMEKIEKAAAEISKMNIFIDHTGGMSLGRIKANVKKQTRVKKIDILMIDYLQLLDMEMKNKNGTEESMISATTRKLKLMAKELGIPVIALSQLSRQVESRGDKRPVMSDLKGSGAIEADADMVMLLYNPSKYFLEPKDERGNDLRNKLEIIFCKNRQGQTGSLMLQVDAATNTFYDDGEMPVKKYEYETKSPF